MQSLQISLLIIVILLLQSRNILQGQEHQVEVTSTNETNNGKGIVVDGAGIGFYADSLSTYGFYNYRSNLDGFISNLANRHGYISAGSGQNGFNSLSSEQDGFQATDDQRFGFAAFNSGQEGFYAQGATVHGFRSQNAGSIGFYTQNSNSFGFRSDNAGTDSFYSEKPDGNGFTSNEPTAIGFFSRSAATTGFHSSFAGIFGFKSEGAGQVGFLTLNSEQDGVLSSGAKGRAGFFVNDATSNSPAVTIGHGDNAITDLLLLETGRINAQKSIVITIDQDDDESSKFILRNGDGIDVVTIKENGDADFIGNISKGGGTFKIDHPLAPTEKYLYHSFIESPDMMNIYNGNVVTDTEGLAIVMLPVYFESLNRDYTYQLTSIGSFGQAIVKEKIKSGFFIIQTEHPSMEVSWQITGVRQDPYAEANRVKVEVDKEPENQGTYLHQEAKLKAESTPKGLN